jgi:hypothetical protein
MYVERVMLPELPQRPWRGYRMSMVVQMQSEKVLHLTIEDEGFGEFYEKLPVGISYDLILGEKGKR